MEERLEALAQEAVADFSRKIRCHEAARLIARHLSAQGLKVCIQDGVVKYHLPSILEGSPLEGMIKLTTEWGSFFHSWCEVSHNEKVFLISWQNLPIENGGIDNWLLLHEEDSILLALI